MTVLRGPHNEPLSPRGVTFAQEEAERTYRVSAFAGENLW